MKKQHKEYSEMLSLYQQEENTSISAIKNAKPKVAKSSLKDDKKVKNKKK